FVINEATSAFDAATVARLVDWASQLGLSQALAATVERSVLGKTKEDRLAHQQVLARYRQEVTGTKPFKLERASIERLANLVSSLGLSQDEAARIEREEMGGTKEMIFDYQRADALYSDEVRT